MRCPVCNKEMKILRDQVWCQTDPDESYTFEAGHWCPTCKVKYSNSTHDWSLPLQFQITEKQHRAIKFISNRLEINSDEYPVTKRQAIQFISKYLSKASKVELDHPDDWDWYTNELYYAMTW